MTTDIGNRASIPNPALEQLDALVGEWLTTGSHPYFPDAALHGRVSIEWLEGGAFLILRSEIDHPQFPDGIEIIGSDNLSKEFFMLHFDSRGISRKYDVVITSNQLKWWRDDPTFSQRFILTMEDGGEKLTSKGEMSQDGGNWEDDLALVYTRSSKA